MPDLVGNSDNQVFVLYVDDELILLNITKQYLERTGGYRIHTASSAEEALCRIQEEKYDAVVSDYQMPEMDGLEFLKKLRADGITIPFIIFTGRGREEVAIEALNAGANYYLQKGGKPKVQFGELQNCIRQAVEKNRAEKRLLERERQMADVINFLPDATFAIDREGRVIAWNRAIEQMTGIPATEMLGKGDYEYALPFYGKRCPILVDLVHNEDLHTEVSYPVLNIETRDKLNAETFIPHLHSGEGAYMWFTASALYGTEGTITGAIESIRDITEYKQTEGLFRTVFENTGTAMAILEDEVTILHFNEKMIQLLGLSGDEPGIFANWQERVVEEDRQKVLEFHCLRRTEPDSVPKSYDFRVAHKNGTEIDVNLTAAMIPGTKKNIVSFIDITALKESERRLKFTQFLVDNAPDGILWADTDGRFFSANQRAVDMFGYSKEELLNMRISDFAPDFPEERFREFWDTAKKKGSFTFEARVSRKDGICVTIEIIIIFLNFEGQNYECGFARDITERKNTENALKTLNKKLNILSSITRHDINNQIGVLMGYEEMLEGEIDKEIAGDYLKRITGATEMIQNMIAFSHDYQELGLHSPTWQSVESVAWSVVSNVSATGIPIRIDIGTLEIFADQMLEKVFYSLFENAVRHGEYVTDISVSFHEEEGNGIIVIEDNGVGVAGDMKEKIFDRGVGSNTGFGLFLTREILDITGISISETGTEGKGARFEITLPKYGYRQEL